MDFEDVQMFAEAMPMLQAREQITHVNVIRLAQGDPKQTRESLRKLEREANKGTQAQVTKLSPDARMILMQSTGMKVRRHVQQ